MRKKSDLNLKFTIWLTSSTLFLVGLFFGLFETSVIIVFYKYLPFNSLFEKVLFFLFCTFIYPVVLGLLGIPLGGLSYFLSQRLGKFSEKVSSEYFLVTCYLFIVVLILAGTRLRSIAETYNRDSLYLYEFIAGFVALLIGAVCVSMLGFSLSKMLESFTRRAAVSICFIISVLMLGGVYSFVKIDGSVAKAKEAEDVEPIEKTSNKKSLETNPALLDLRETNIIIITIDTLRADHLSLYGYGRKTSPNVDGFAKKSTLFTGAKTQVTLTAPSLASVLTGTYSNRHLVNMNGVALQDFNITLPETLKRYGYKTAAFLSNPSLDVKFGFNQGFDDFGEWTNVKKDELTESRGLNKKIIPWLKKNSGQKFFLWVHYRDPHAPYIVPPGYEKLYRNDGMYGKHSNKRIKIGNSPFGEIIYKVALNGSTDIDYYISQYDAEIKFNDDSIGELFKAFEELKLFQNSLIILTADHGESLGEHNYYFFHGDYTYESTARVPLIIHHASLPEGWVVNNIVELVDVYPTIMDLLGLPLGTQVQGKSLLPVIYGNSSDSEFEYARIVANHHFGYQTHAIRDRRWKLIYDVNEYWVYFDRIVEDWLRFWKQKKGINPYRCRVFKTELYDLESDPGETRNLSASEPPVEYRLRTLLFEWIDSGNYEIGTEARKKGELDRETVERLKALGYIN